MPRSIYFLGTGYLISLHTPLVLSASIGLLPISGSSGGQKHSVTSVNYAKIMYKNIPPRDEDLAIHLQLTSALQQGLDFSASVKLSCALFDAITATRCPKSSHLCQMEADVQALGLAARFCLLCPQHLGDSGSRRGHPSWGRARWQTCRSGNSRLLCARNPQLIKAGWKSFLLIP